MSRWERYGEARLYLGLGAAGLLVLIWNILAQSDGSNPAGTETQPNTGSTSVAVQPSAQVHTRTRAS
jgi:hypothetical protein